MKFIPAIDLKDNRCVRLERGREENLTVFNENPVEQAKYFEEKGCDRIHIVDLDGAFGRPDINKNTIVQIRKNINIQIEFGGGIKNENDISFWFGEGLDFLIVGLNSDSSVKKIKGNSRPVINESDRARVLCSLEVVDAVIIFNQNTPIDLIKNIKPNLLIKGNDYSENQVVGHKEVKKWGGKVELIPLLEGRSSSKIIKKIS